MKRVILDTNFLLAIGQFGIDVFSELERICDFPYKVFVLDKTIGELNKVLTTGGKDKAAAKLALSLVKEKVEVIRTSDGYVDDILVQLANGDNIVATQDKELKDRIKTRVITIKQKKYLAFGNV
jgi:hypothetical protein